MTLFGDNPHKKANKMHEKRMKQWAHTQINILISFLGISMLALASVQGYHGYLLFSWMYGVFLGGFEFSLKIYTLERVRVRQFPRGWGFVQGVKALPALIGIPIAGYINESASNPKAGFYFSVVTCFISAIVLFFVDSFYTITGSNQLGLTSQPYTYDNRGELCKTDTNLTFELLGGGIQGNVPDSASVDSAGALQLMMMRNGGNRLERQLSIFQVGSSSSGNGSMRRKHSDSLVMKSVSNSFVSPFENNNPNKIDTCSKVDQSLQCTCHPSESSGRKISLQSHNSEIVKETVLPVKKKISTGSTYVEKNGIYDELSDNESIINEHEDMNNMLQLSSDTGNESASNSAGQYLQETHDDIIQFSTPNLISISRGQHNAIDDEVEEGGDILIDEELLAEAAEEEPELLSCTLIDIPLDVFDNNNQCIATTDLPMQPKTSLSYSENNGDILGMINEEDEELVSPEHKFQYSQILNKQNSTSQLFNKNFSLSEPEINRIGREDEDENFNEIVPSQKEVATEQVCLSLKKSNGRESIKEEQDILNMNGENGIHSAAVDIDRELKPFQELSELNTSPATLNVSSTSNPANTNAFHAITTRAEVTSYV